MSTPQGIMRTFGRIGEAFGGISADDMQQMFGKTFYLDSNKAINGIKANSYWDSLMYGLNRRFIMKQGDEWVANEKLLRKIGATRKEVKDAQGNVVKDGNGNTQYRWDVSAWNRAKSLAYQTNGEAAIARNTAGALAGSYMGFSVLSDLTTARHGAGVPYM